MSKRMKIIGTVIGLSILALLMVVVAMSKRQVKKDDGWSVKAESSTQSVSSVSVQPQTNSEPVTVTPSDTKENTTKQPGITQKEVTPQKNTADDTTTPTPTPTITDNANLSTNNPVTTDEDMKKYEEKQAQEAQKMKAEIEKLEAEETKQAEEETAQREKESEEASKAQTEQGEQENTANVNHEIEGEEITSSSQE